MLNKLGYGYCGTLLSNKKEGTSDAHNNVMNLQGILLSEKIQSQKITFILDFWNDKFLEIENRLVVVRGGGWSGDGYKRAAQGTVCILTVVVVTRITQVIKLQ